MPPGPGLDVVQFWRIAHAGIRDTGIVSSSCEGADLRYSRLFWCPSKGFGLVAVVKAGDLQQSITEKTQAHGLCRRLQYIGKANLLRRANGLWGIEVFSVRYPWTEQLRRWQILSRGSKRVGIWSIHLKTSEILSQWCTQYRKTVNVLFHEHNLQLPCSVDGGMNWHLTGIQ